MICYKDMTFCEAKDCVKWDTCYRALTDQVCKDADAWWGDGDAPIAVFMGQPECYAEGEGNDLPST